MSYFRLRLLLSTLFIALALPTSILVYQAYGQLKWEAFHQHQQLARELTLRIDAGFRDLLAREESRPFTDYQFLNVTGSKENTFLQRSPLSAYPLDTSTPGLLGYFQVDAEGQLQTPIVPSSDSSNYGISSTEMQLRLQQESQILTILDQNRLVGKTAAKNDVDEDIAGIEEQSVYREERAATVEESEASGLTTSDIARDLANEAQGQLVFDELKSSAEKRIQSGAAFSNQVKDLKLEDSYAIASSPREESRVKSKRNNEAKRSRKEIANLPESISLQGVIEPSLSLNSQILKYKSDKNAESDDVDISLLLNQQKLIRIQTFESEVDPMEFSQLDSGHFVLFRRVWQNEKRFIQGLLIDQDSFIDELVRTAFEESGLFTMTKLIIAFQGAILHSFTPEYSRDYSPSIRQTENELLYQSRLITPFSDIELIYTLSRLPVGAGGQIIIWSALVLAIVLMGGFLMLYRLAINQILLARQQQDFVSAVSHELKTPLTSIRMYGEILRAGWADEARKKTYYDFIFFESERLTRLINNVLQLARISRNEKTVSLNKLTVQSTIEELKPRLVIQLEQSGFDLNISGEAAADQKLIQIDIDWFIQIFINLVDNAIKFSSSASNKKIDISYQVLQNSAVQFSVRDYGPGIAADQMKKIFRLFYRSENELTRETAGTGIGLALVRQLATAMDAEVDVVNCDIGSEFRIVFKTV